MTRTELEARLGRQISSGEWAHWEELFGPELWPHRGNGRVQGTTNGISVYTGARAESENGWHGPPNARFSVAGKPPLPEKAATEPTQECHQLQVGDWSAVLAWVMTVAAPTVTAFITANPALALVVGVGALGVVWLWRRSKR